MLFFFLFPFFSLAPELAPSLLPVDFAIDSCGFGDAIPHFTATKKEQQARLRVIKEETLITGCFCVSVCVLWMLWALWF